MNVCDGGYLKACVIHEKRAEYTDSTFFFFFFFLRALNQLPAVIAARVKHTLLSALRYLKAVHMYICAFRVLFCIMRSRLEGKTAYTDSNS